MPNRRTEVAEIYRTRDHDPYGDLEFCVEWEDNDRVRRTRYFKSYRAAGRYAVQVEVDLLNEGVLDYLGAIKAQQKKNNAR
jgi:hypothetical protein